MKRLLFAVLMTVCSVSWAGWEYTGETDTRIDYHDKNTIRRSGVITKMWVMAEYIVNQTNSSGGIFKSDKTQFGYNCREEKSTIVSLVQYSGSKGTGEVVYSADIKDSRLDWTSVVPGSADEVMFKIACSKR